MAGYGRHGKLEVGFRTAGYSRHRRQWVNTLFSQVYTFFDSSLCLFLLRAGQGMPSPSKAIKNWLLMLKLLFVALRFQFDFAPLNPLNHGSHQRVRLVDQIPLKIR